MSYRNFRKKVKTVNDKTFDAFTPIKAYIPNEIAQLLQDVSLQRNIPVSRLIAIAIDNELDTPYPFNFPCEAPKDKYHEYMYLKEANKIAEFVAQFPQGIGIDTIMLCRRALQIPDRDTVMCAIRELIQKEMAEEFKPIGKVMNKSYNRIRIVDDVREQIKKNHSFKRVEGDSMLGLKRISDEEIKK